MSFGGRKTRSNVFALQQPAAAKGTRDTKKEWAERVKTNNWPNPALCTEDWNQNESAFGKGPEKGVPFVCVALVGDPSIIFLLLNGWQDLGYR